MPRSLRVTLSQMVKELKQQPLFSKVDLLSEDLRRDLADPSVLLTNRHYALALEFAETNHLQQVQTRKRWPPRHSSPNCPRTRLARFPPVVSMRLHLRDYQRRMFLPLLAMASQRIT